MSDFEFTKQSTPHERVREFYRWLFEARERERIIKLLRDVGYPESTIALIKGENK
jgi:hypothetical protein